MNDQKIRYTVLSPGGNDTCLCRSQDENGNSLLNRSKTREINDVILALSPKVEQVGFINISNEGGKLRMAGGEFCGNATRSAAWVLSGGQKGNSLEMQVSGVDPNRRLEAGVDSKNAAWAEIPIYSDLSSVRPGEDSNEYLVEIEGISFVVVYDEEFDPKIDEKDIKEAAMKKLESVGFLEKLAAGVVYVRKSITGIKIDPVVYVKEVDTCYYETACGSGTTAVGLAEAYRSGQSLQGLEVEQPSGESIVVGIERNDQEFESAYISGEVKTLSSGVLILSEDSTYLVENIIDEIAFIRVLDDLIRLYVNSTETNLDRESARSLLTSYWKSGSLFVARNYSGNVGFAALNPENQELILVDSSQDYKTINSLKDECLSSVLQEVKL